jgi:cholesterol oxidase
MHNTLSLSIEDVREHYDVVVIGSGYGGGIASSRLARAGKSVCLLERGEEKQPGDYPNSELALLNEVQFDSPKLRAGSHTALFDIRYNKDINVVVGCGLGGTSLINAGICLRPDPRIMATDAWPAELRTEALLDRYFSHAEDMLKPSFSPDDYLRSSKTTALGEAAMRLHKDAIPVAVLVNFRPLASNVNHVGVTQYPCVGCGDCVSGCNYSAKNTVIMNYLPDAKSHSAEIFTRARVHHVEKTNAGWCVYGNTDGKGNGAAFKVGANIVILAAGTLGSTEVLLRSRKYGLPLSKQLGNHFSANGDSIGFAYNTDRVVNGIGLGVREPDHNHPIGPCSTVMVDWRGDDDINGSMIMEDGAIPGSLSNLLPALFAIEARLLGTHASQGTWETIKKKYREVQSKLLGAYTGATRNTSFLLLVAHDDSKGRMYLEDDRLRIDWPGLGTQEQFVKANEMMQRVTRALGGTYIPNPIWNELTNHNLVTGHPLGGCAMGDDAERGVVNHKSQVFSGESGGGVHEGLYVMDGSIVPAALGVNPLFTISALAERNCHLLAQDYGWAIDYTLN